MSHKPSVTTPEKVRYALIMPVRDEEKYLSAMIDSILGQRVRPARWIIVDDGSTDRTPAIAESYAQRFNFIELIRLPVRDQRMPGGEGALPNALRRLNLSDFDYLARFDGDLLFGPDYIAQILEEFDRDRELGIAGGSLYSKRNGRLKLEADPTFHVRGALKMYRRQCFQDIGGLTTQIGWDTIDEVYAWIKGWTTRSFYQYKVLHRRPTGAGWHARRIYWERGRADYLTWSLPLFALAKTAKTAVASLSCLKAICYLAGFVSCYVRNESRIQDPAFAKARRHQQRNRMVALLMLRRNPFRHALGPANPRRPRQI
jgi:glycosyltransferase involved in cell wall biosynthesis